MRLRTFLFIIAASVLGISVLTLLTCLTIWSNGVFLAIIVVGAILFFVIHELVNYDCTGDSAVDDIVDWVEDIRYRRSMRPVRVRRIKKGVKS